MKPLMVCLEVSIPDHMDEKRAVMLLNMVISLGLKEAQIEVDHTPVVATEFYDIRDMHLGQVMPATTREQAVL